MIRKNDIRRSGEVGVLFRQEDGSAFSANRNHLEENRILDSGGVKGIAVKVEGQTESVEIVRNELRETRGPAARIGVRVSPEAKDIRVADNRIEGFRQAVVTS